MAGTLPHQVLQLKLENDGSVSDWLGTAAVAARVAAGRIDQIRTEQVSDTEAHLALVESGLKQALEEVTAVKLRIEGRNAAIAFAMETAATQRMVADMEADGLL
jgi:hypothetical protein